MPTKPSEFANKPHCKTKVYMTKFPALYRNSRLVLNGSISHVTGRTVNNVYLNQHLMHIFRESHI